MLRLLALFVLSTSALAQQQPMEAFCDGDAQCPCGPNGLTYDAGCPNSATAGASLEIFSDTWEYADYMSQGEGVVMLRHLPPSAAAVICQATLAHAPTAFGDGVRCIGGSMIRVAVVQASAGVAQYPMPGQPSLSERGQIQFNSGYRAYQAIYRNIAAFCTPSTWNTTNAWGIMWV